MNKKLHILFALRPDYKENPGGDTIQMETWCSSLQKCGYSITLSCDCGDESILKQCDIIFIWHLERVHESFPWWKRAASKNIPVVLVPTCWHAEKRFFGYSLFKQAELLIRSFFCKPSMLFYSWSHCKKIMLTKSALLIVNSNAERNLLIQEGAKAASLAVVPNVVTQASIAIEPLKWEDRTRVACIGHFCPRKNQLALINALKGLSIRITFVGGARPMHKRYMNQCINAAAGQHEFLGKLSHEETLQVIKTCKYAVSTSLAETPGIANLEAAIVGCGLILPALAPIQEYFYGCPVHYIEPRNIDPKALERMLSVPPDPVLRQRMREKYTEDVLPEFWARQDLARISMQSTGETNAN